ncbi:hypothetical protein ACFFJI_08020 [Allobacillus sp. GCM10007491]|uniref:CNNM transmembrane domain-containing protein n=2 Tax=Allobacillus TaxID=1400133 RepID=A0A941HTT5_9BACI|nr:MULTISPECIES: hypothetical protein [Allobacillus]MBR7554170.1 hypothetical protein [Allobacillus saliphilus]TSJ67657.1 hypothetical protein FPQ13_00885 [Allobacillus salarius]
MKKSLLKRSIKFSIGIAVITAVLAAIFSVISNASLEGTSWYLGLLIVLFIVLIGVFFDMMGVAAAAANEKPFHSMASEKVNGAREAIVIVRNADRFATFCNDVIGDISGIISGAASTLVVIQLAVVLQSDVTNLQFILNIILTSFVAALTVGGKAIAKTYAIHRSTNIILVVGKMFAFFDKKLHIKILPDLKKKKRKEI